MTILPFAPLTVGIGISIKYVYLLFLWLLQRLLSSTQLNLQTFAPFFFGFSPLPHLSLLIIVDDPPLFSYFFGSLLIDFLSTLTLFQ